MGIYANDIQFARHAFIKAVMLRLLGINGYVQIPTGKNKRKSPLQGTLHRQITKKQYVDFCNNFKVGFA